MDKKLLDKVIELRLADAESARLSAAYGGAYHDGGSGNLLNQVKFFNYGRNGTFPPEWNETLKKAKKILLQEENSVEYRKFLELKKKFEGE